MTSRICNPRRVNVKLWPPVKTMRRRFTFSRSPCRGFTLMEMILVLAILVAVAALALPALQGPMDDHRLRKAGDLVRAELGKARLAAMETGQIHIFSYLIGTGNYSVQPWAGDGDYLEASTADVAPIAPRQLRPQDESNPLGVSGLILPPGVVFHSGSSELDARSAEVTGSADAGAATLGGEQSIVFYPDGSAPDAKVTLTNNRFFVEVHLRGLTGLTRGSDLLTADELTP